MADAAYDVLLETDIDISPLTVRPEEWEHPEKHSNPTRLRKIAREKIRLRRRTEWASTQKMGRFLKYAETFRYVADYEGDPVELSDARDMVEPAEIFVATMQAQFRSTGAS